MLAGVSGTQLLWYLTAAYGAYRLGDPDDWVDHGLRWCCWGGFGVLLPFMCSFDVMVSLGSTQSQKGFLSTTFPTLVGLSLLTGFLLFFLAMPGAPEWMARTATLAIMMSFLYLNLQIPEPEQQDLAHRPRKKGRPQHQHSHSHSHTHG